MNVERNENNTSILSVLDASFHSSLFYLSDFYFLGQLPIVFSALRSGSASNQNTSLHDVTAATVTASKTKISIMVQYIAFT